MNVFRIKIGKGSALINTAQGGRSDGVGPVLHICSRFFHSSAKRHKERPEVTVGSGENRGIQADLEVPWERMVDTGIPEQAFECRPMGTRDHGRPWKKTVRDSVKSEWAIAQAM